MARTYRKTDDAAAKLRKALGILQAPAALQGDNPWRTIGAVQAIVEYALIDLDGPTNFEDSPEYAEGKAKVTAWDQPELPLEG